MRLKLASDCVRTVPMSRLPIAMSRLPIAKRVRHKKVQRGEYWIAELYPGDARRLQQETVCYPCGNDCGRAKAKAQRHLLHNVQGTLHGKHPAAQSFTPVFRTGSRHPKNASEGPRKLPLGLQVGPCWTKTKGKHKLSRAFQRLGPPVRVPELTGRTSRLFREPDFCVFGTKS